MRGVTHPATPRGFGRSHTLSDNLDRCKCKLKLTHTAGCHAGPGKASPKRCARGAHFVAVRETLVGLGASRLAALRTPRRCRRRAPVACGILCPQQRPRGPSARPALPCRGPDRGRPAGICTGVWQPGQVRFAGRPAHPAAASPRSPKASIAARTCSLRPCGGGGKGRARPANMPTRPRDERMRLMPCAVDGALTASARFSATVNDAPGIAGRVTLDTTDHAGRVASWASSGPTRRAMPPTATRAARDADLGGSRHGRDMRLSVLQSPPKGPADAASMCGPIRLADDRARAIGLRPAGRVAPGQCCRRQGRGRPGLLAPPDGRQLPHHRLESCLCGQWIAGARKDRAAASGAPVRADRRCRPRPCRRTDTSLRAARSSSLKGWSRRRPGTQASACNLS